MKAKTGYNSGTVTLNPKNRCGTGIGSSIDIAITGDDSDTGGPSVWEKTVLSPNPTSGDIEVFFPAENKVDDRSMPDFYLVKIFDQYKTLLIEKRFNARKSRLSTSGLKPGIYIVQIITPDGVLSEQLIKD